MADSVVGRLIYTITGDSSALDSSLDKSRARITQTGESLQKLGSRIKSLAATAISGYLIKSLLDASSRVEELGNKFDTVFSGMEGVADAWARKYADATSRGVTATKEFLATQQDIRTGYGDSTEKAALFSQAVVGVTNDLASFSNVPIEEAMQSVNSGLSQQFEALRRLGVGLNVQIINQGEYAKQLGKTWDEMSNLERQEAILSGIVSQSKNALHQNIQLWQEYDYTIGDAAITSKSFANSSQGLRQSFDDMKAELGDAILPLVTDLIGIALDGVKAFNSWDDSIQSLTIAALAFGTAMISIGGPVGAVIGSLGALAIVISSQKTETEKLTQATDNLKEITADYKVVISELDTDTSRLSKSELALLETRKKLLGLKAMEKMGELSKSYEKTSDDIRTLGENEALAKKMVDLYTLAVEDANNKTSSSVKAFRDSQEFNSLLWQEADIALDSLTKKKADYTKLAAEFGQDLVDYSTVEANLGIEIAEKEEALQSAILEISQAVLIGAASVDAYAQSYPELYAAIMETVESLKQAAKATSGSNDEIAKAIVIGREWQDQRKAQRADLLEEEGHYREAAVLRNEMLESERKADIKSLAVKAGIIKEEAELTDSLLQEKLESNKEFAAEYNALNLYYEDEALRITQDSNKKKTAAEKELADKRMESAQEWIDKLKDQGNAEKEALAQEKEGNGDIEGAYRLRLELLEEEHLATRAALEKKIQDKEATDEDLKNLDAYYVNETVRIESKKNAALKAAADELEKKRREYAAEWIKKLKDQGNAEKEASAQEKEGNGDIEGAYRLRLELLEEERLATRATLEKKIQDKEATDEDLKNLDAYYANEAVRIESDKNAALKAAADELDKKRRDNAAEWISKLRDQGNAALENAASELEANGNIEAAYSIRTSLLKAQLATEKGALQAKIDANEATSDDMVSLERYYANEIEQINKDKQQAIVNVDEQTQKERMELLEEYASAAIDSAKSIGNSIVDIFSLQTDRQIEEIDRQTEAKLQALGLAEKTDKETLESEYAEAVKNGDMELAKEKSDALAKLQIEEEAEAEKARFLEKQAERERNMRVFSATIDMLSAIVRYLADPGGLAGVGLSAMAAATGAMQIAAIKAEKLPSFAVGVNYVPEDMLAVIHQGETILPAPMAESVRRGDAVLGEGGTNVYVNIQNHSHENVDVSQGNDERELVITIGKVVDGQISSGRYDASLGYRYGLRRRGRDA